MTNYIDPHKFPGYMYLRDELLGPGGPPAPVDGSLVVRAVTELTPCTTGEVHELSLGEIELI